MEDHDEKKKLSETAIDDLVEKVLPNFIVELIKVYGYLSLGDLTEFEENDVEDLEAFVTSGKLSGRVDLTDPETKQKYLGVPHVDPADFSFLPMEKKKMKKLKVMAEEEMVRLASLEMKKRSSLFNDLKYKAKKLVEDGNDVKVSKVTSKDNISSSDVVELQRSILMARIIEAANQFWSPIIGKLKVDESMISIEQDPLSGDIESGKISCLICSRSCKLNITKKKKAQDMSNNYIALSNYKKHILTSHSNLARQSTLRDPLKMCLKSEQQLKMCLKSDQQRKIQKKASKRKLDDETDQEYFGLSFDEIESFSCPTENKKIKVEAEETTKKKLPSSGKKKMIKNEQKTGKKSKVQNVQKTSIEDNKDQEDVEGFENQRDSLITRTIELANELWSRAGCKLKVNESMIKIRQDPHTGDIESGKISCLLCSLIFKVNVTKRTNARYGSSNYIALSNYKKHILKLHTTQPKSKDNDHDEEDPEESNRSRYDKHP